MSTVVLAHLADIVLQNVPTRGTYRVWLGNLEGSGTSGTPRTAFFEEKVQAFNLADLRPSDLLPDTGKIDGVELVNQLHNTRGIYPCGAKTFGWVGLNYFMNPATSYLEQLRKQGYSNVYFPGTILLEDGDLTNMPYMLAYQYTEQAGWRPTLYMLKEDYYKHDAFLVFQPADGMMD